MVTRSKECARRALVCLLNLAITLESLIAVLVFDHSSHNKKDSDDKQYNSLVTLWILMQYASFGASIVFAVAVWIARNARALVLLSNALFFALYGLQWLVLAICTFAEGYSTTGTVFAALALHPLLGSSLSRSLGREAHEEAERQEALEITLEHEESMYHSAEV